MAMVKFIFWTLSVFLLLGCAAGGGAPETVAGSEKAVSPETALSSETAIRPEKPILPQKTVRAGSAFSKESSLVPQETIEFELTYDYFSEDLERLDDHSESDVSLVFPSIPGQIFGSASGDIVTFSETEASGAFHLELPANMDNQAEVMTLDGINVSPANTKILRLATFHVLPEHEMSFGGGAFHSKETNEFLILVYFSQAADITGELVMDGDLYKHNISVDEPGWHWIKIVDTGDNEYHLSPSSASEESIEFSVIVDVGLSV